MREENCIFCKLANGEIPSATIYEDEDFRVFLDLNPASRGHALIVPKEHFADLFELDEEHCRKALALAKKIGARMKEKLGIWYRITGKRQDRPYFIFTCT